MFEDNMLHPLDIIQSHRKTQFEKFNVSNTWEQFIYHGNEREDQIIIFVTR